MDLARYEIKKIRNSSKIIFVKPAKCNTAQPHHIFIFYMQHYETHIKTDLLAEQKLNPRAHHRYDFPRGLNIFIMHSDDGASGFLF